MAKTKLRLLRGAKEEPDELALAAEALETALASVEGVKAVTWDRSSQIGQHQIRINLEVSLMESLLGIIRVVRDAHFQSFRRTWNEDLTARWAASIVGTNRKFLKVALELEMARDAQLGSWVRQVAHELSGVS